MVCIVLLLSIGHLIAAELRSVCQSFGVGQFWSAFLGQLYVGVNTAHKIARIVYHLLKYGEAYEAESAAAYEQQRQEREPRQLTRRAAKLGYTLAPAQELLADTSP